MLEIHEGLTVSLPGRHTLLLHRAKGDNLTPDDNINYLIEIGPLKGYCTNPVRQSISAPLHTITHVPVGQ